MQLTLSNFPKRNACSISIEQVFERMGSVFEPSNTTPLKLIRLAKDLAEQDGPTLFFNYHENVRSVLKTNIADELIDSVIPIDDTVYPLQVTEIEYKNGRYIFKAKKVRRL
jgi:hypothetical protein